MSIPQHTSNEATPGDRGLAFGRRFAPEVENTVRSYQRLFASTHDVQQAEIERLGETVGETLHARWPHLLEEIEGIAAGSRQSARELLAINARTEILSGASAPECSAVALLPEATRHGETILAQNWDWHPEQVASRVIWHVVESPHRWFTTVTEAGILGKLGMNSRGIGVALNLLATTLDGGVSHTPIHIMLRLLLQESDNLGHALRLLLNEQYSASSCILVGYADKDGGMVVAAEVSPAGTNLVWPDEAGRLVHTNHFVDGPPAGKDTIPTLWPDTYLRLIEVQRRLKALNGAAGVEDVQGLLGSHFNWPIAVCCHDYGNGRYVEQQGSLLSMILDVRGGRMLVSDGNPCTAQYEAIELPGAAGRLAGAAVGVAS